MILIFICSLLFIIGVILCIAVLIIEKQTTDLRDQLNQAQEYAVQTRAAIEHLSQPVRHRHIQPAFSTMIGTTED